MVADSDAYARTRDAYVVASLIPAGVDELVRMAGAIEAAGVRWLEVNLGAAHGEEAVQGAIELVAETARVKEIVGRVRATVALPLTVKVAGHGDVLGLAAAARGAGADSVCLAGRTLGFLPDLDTRRPVLGTFGAVGGAWALPLTLRWVAKARRRLGPEFPLLATNGVRDGRDTARALLAGASAVELATAVWIDGFDVLTRAIDQLVVYLEEQDLDAADLIGESADAAMTYEEVQAVRRPT
jgi:dihydroorotate dehydrogenase (NAD+) catalytic subunit